MQPDHHNTEDGRNVIVRCKAAVLYQYNTPFVIEEIAVQKPRAKEILVKLWASGICHSDLLSVKGIFADRLPTILGHEGSGVVVEVGPEVMDFAVGDHVVLNWKPACRHCRPCLRGKPQLCEGSSWVNTGCMKDGTGRYSIDGQQILQSAGVSTFAEYAVVEDVSCVKIDRTLPLIPMSLIGCAVTTGVGAAVNTASIRNGDKVVVIGCGGVGLSAIQGAKIKGAGMIIAVDQSDASLEIAKRLGATHIVNAARNDPRDFIMRSTEGGADFAFEAVGRKDTMELAASVLARGAEAILIGIANPDVRVETTPFTLVRSEHVVRGSFFGAAAPEENIPKFAKYYQDGLLDLNSMVQVRKLDEINEIFAEIERGAVGRNVIVFDGLN